MLEFSLLGTLLVASFGAEWGILSEGRHWWKVVTGQLYTEEEEILTRYESQEDSAPAEDMELNGSSKQVSRDPCLNGWEFKIVRASRNVFRDPAVFQQLCEEEAQAGWILLEKLDDRRVRFKRPLALRDLVKQESLSFDPYRCYYNPSSTPSTKLGTSSATRIPFAIAVVFAMILPAYFGYTFVSGMLANSRNSSPPSPPPQSFPPK